MIKQGGLEITVISTKILAGFMFIEPIRLIPTKNEKK